MSKCHTQFWGDTSLKLSEELRLEIPTGESAVQVIMKMKHDPPNSEGEAAHTKP